MTRRPLPNPPACGEPPILLEQDAMYSLARANTTAFACSSKHYALHLARPKCRVSSLPSHATMPHQVSTPLARTPGRPPSFSNLKALGCGRHGTVMVTLFRELESPPRPRQPATAARSPRPPSPAASRAVHVTANGPVGPA